MELRGHRDFAWLPHQGPPCHRRLRAWAATSLPADAPGLPGHLGLGVAALLAGLRAELPLWSVQLGRKSRVVMLSWRVLRPLSSLGPEPRHWRSGQLLLAPNCRCLGLRPEPQPHRRARRVPALVCQLVRLYGAMLGVQRVEPADSDQLHVLRCFAGPSEGAHNEGVHAWQPHELQLLLDDAVLAPAVDRRPASTLISPGAALMALPSRSHQVGAVLRWRWPPG
mmetsp:Transcript_102652/g.285975  ORF Transcript_102652/g.285975 Transcript_102652/m.285975 type:complete len:224 (-) Transcript_102652:423-1094(-)